MTTTDLVDRLSSNQLIVELLAARGRAADAKDPDAIVACHVPGSRDAHGINNGTIEQLAQYLRTHNYADKRYGAQQHTIANILIKFDSADVARTESYHLAHHRLHLEGTAVDVLIGGRYLDRCERIDGRWLIRSRAVVYDWSGSETATTPGRPAGPHHDHGGHVTDPNRRPERATAPGGADAAAVARLLAKQEITDVLHRRARAGDRKDVELAMSCYHPDATEDHEGFQGTAAEFISQISMIAATNTAPVDSLWHFISNILIDLDGDDADVESYHLAVVIRHDNDEPTESYIGGRYLDRFSFRDGRWAIANRKVVFDWSRVSPPTTTYWQLMGLDESKLLRGSFGPDDPLYRELGVARGPVSG